MKLSIFNNFELMTFYHVQGQTHVLLKLVILRLNKQTVSVFQCHLLISNVIYQVHMNLFNLDQSTMGQLSWCTQRSDMSIGEVSHGTPFINTI